MSLVNEAARRPGALTRSQAERWLRGMAPLAPHICEELWSLLGHDGSICEVAPPDVDERFLEQDTFELVVQVMGKLRGRVQAPRDADKEALEALARETCAEQLAGKQVVKTIVVPGRLVNFVVRDAG